MRPKKKPKRSRKVMIEGEWVTIPNDEYSAAEWRRTLIGARQMKRRHLKKCERLGLTPNRLDYDGA